LRRKAIGKESEYSNIQEFGTNAHLITWNGVGKFKTWLIYQKEFITPTPHSNCSLFESSDAKRNLHQKNTIGAKKFV